MSEATDGPASGSTEPDWDEAEWEEFGALLDAMPSLDRLGERLARLQRRVQESLESDEPQVETTEDIEAELEEIREQLESLGI